MLVVDGGQQVAAEIIRQVAAAQTAVYGSPAVHDPALSPVTLALVEGDVVIGALDVLTKDLSHAGQQYRASGLSWVLTALEQRGHGYGRRLVRDAMQYLSRSPIDLVIFTCDRPLQHFYESAGYVCMPQTVLVGGTPGNPFPSDQPGFDKVTMASFISDRARLHSSDFAHCHVELYPGDIDKLW
jgi:GNAT superfamily N-acetyltransferase